MDWGYLSRDEVGREAHVRNLSVDDHGLGR